MMGVIISAFILFLTFLFSWKFQMTSLDACRTFLLFYVAFMVTYIIAISITLTHSILQAGDSNSVRFQYRFLGSLGIIFGADRFMVRNNQNIYKKDMLIGCGPFLFYCALLSLEMYKGIPRGRWITLIVVLVLLALMSFGMHRVAP